MINGNVALPARERERDGEKVDKKTHGVCVVKYNSLLVFKWYHPWWPSIVNVFVLVNGAACAWPSAHGQYCCTHRQRRQVNYLCSFASLKPCKKLHLSHWSRLIVAHTPDKATATGMHETPCPFDSSPSSPMCGS